MAKRVKMFYTVFDDSLFHPSEQLARETSSVANRAVKHAPKSKRMRSVVILYLHINARAACIMALV